MFALFAAFLLGYFAWNTRRLITEQITQTVDAEITGLAEQYRQGGIRRLVFVVDAQIAAAGLEPLSRHHPARAKGLPAMSARLPPASSKRRAGRETAYRRLDDPDGAEHHALVRVFQLPGGFRLLVGRDLEERERLHDIVLAAGRWSLAIVVVLGVAGGFFVTRRVLKRVDAMTDTTRKIMDGDLAGRLPIAGTGDELDRLADNLNAMLERIEALMHGLKEVSDNIAHDLKTPLTRLRNRCEEALRLAEDELQYRAALESTIEESDALIRTFNALLDDRAGGIGPGARRHDRVRRRRDRARRRRTLRAARRRQGHPAQGRSADAAPVHGNRELISQALANLVDNAIKYGAPDHTGGVNGAAAEIVVKAVGEGDRILLTVADGGHGIPEADRGRAVERFVRLEQSRSKPGSGLGLSLASAVARLHGGELKLEDNHPGLRTVISLPRAALAAAVH